jgi:hypothetical protein
MTGIVRYDCIQLSYHFSNCPAGGAHLWQASPGNKYRITLRQDNDYLAAGPRNAVLERLN